MTSCAGSLFLSNLEQSIRGRSIEVWWQASKMGNRACGNPLFAPGYFVQPFNLEHIMDILEIARKSGMTIVLDAKIGRQEYQTVHGSLPALQRFAELVRASIPHETHECG